MSEAPSKPSESPPRAKNLPPTPIRSQESNQAPKLILPPACISSPYTESPNKTCVDGKPKTPSWPGVPVVTSGGSELPLAQAHM